VPTLNEFKEAFGTRLDAAMERVEDFTVPRSLFCDLGQVHTFEDLPRIIYYWSLRPNRGAVLDVKVVKDYAAMTAKSTQRIPHDIILQVKAIDAEVYGAERMRDAMLEEFGDSPCVSEIPLLYQGFVDAPQEFQNGIYTFTFTYEGLIFLDGRSAENPLIESVVNTIHFGDSITETEVVDDRPIPDPYSVTVTEIEGDVLTP